MVSSRISVRSRRRLGSGRKRGSRGIKLLLLLALTGLSCYGAKRTNLKSYFTVREVSVLNTVYIPQAEIGSLCETSLLGRNMLKSLSEGAEEIKKHALVRNVSLHRTFPDRVKVVVEEREPVALLNNGELLPVDCEGFILPIEGQAGRTDLPILTPRKAAYENAEQNDPRHRMDKDGRMLLETSLAFRRMAPEVLPLISEFTVNSEGKIMLVIMDDAVQVVIGKWVRPETVRYLKWMMARLAEGGNKPHEVDLSYDGQIIVKDGNGI